MTYDHICVYQYVSDSSYRFLCCDCGLKKLASQPHPLPVSMLHGSEVQHRNIHFAGSTVTMTRIAFSNIFATALGWEAQFGLGRLLGWEATLQFFVFCC